MAFKQSTNNDNADFEFPTWTPDKEQDAQEVAANNRLPPPPGELIKFEIGKTLFLRAMPPIKGGLWADAIGHMFKQKKTGKFVRFPCPAYETRNKERRERCAACERSAELAKQSAYQSEERKRSGDLALKQQKVTQVVDLNCPSAGIRKLYATPRTRKTDGLFELFTKLSDAGVGYWLPEGVDGRTGLVIPVVKEGADMAITYKMEVPLLRLPGVSIEDIGKFSYEIKTDERNRAVVVQKEIQPRGIRTRREWAADYFDLTPDNYIPTYEETRAYVEGTAVPEQRTMQSEMNAARSPAPDLSRFEDGD